MNAVRATHLRALQHSIMTGELSAAQRLGAALADDVTCTFGTDSFDGREAVLARLSGDWAGTFALRHLVWDAPVESGDRVQVAGSVHGQAAWAPRGTRLDVTFTADDRIAAVTVEMVNQPPGEPESTIPAIARGLINNARVTNHPMCIAHVTPDGKPAQTFRGSIQVYSDTQLCAWVRFPEGGFATAIAAKPDVSVIYQDSPDSHLFISGTARIDGSDAVRADVFALVPEVEQLHDPAMKGTALIIDVTGIRGWIKDAWVIMQA